MDGASPFGSPRQRAVSPYRTRTLVEPAQVSAAATMERRAEKMTARLRLPKKARIQIDSLSAVKAIGCRRSRRTSNQVVRVNRETGVSRNSRLVAIARTARADRIVSNDM
jgi:hypothetical protein